MITKPVISISDLIGFYLSLLQKNKAVSMAAASSLDEKMADLHATLSKIREESELQINKLRKESEDATRTIVRLQEQLKQQSDYENMKKEIQ